MTGRRRAAPRRAARSTARRGGGGSFNLNPEVVRSLVGIAILVVGIVTLIALLLPGRGQLTDLWRNLIAPWFGTGRWLLPPILIVAGLFVQRARGEGSRWGLALLGAAVAYVGFLGAIDGPNLANGGRVAGTGSGPSPRRRSAHDVRAFAQSRRRSVYAAVSVAVGTKGAVCSSISARISSTKRSRSSCVCSSRWPF